MSALRDEVARDPSCDWSGCKKLATHVARRRGRSFFDYPRPSWTAKLLLFCDEHIRADPGSKRQIHRLSGATERNAQ